MQWGESACPPLKTVLEGTYRTYSHLWSHRVGTVGGGVLNKSDFSLCLISSVLFPLSRVNPNKTHKEMAKNENESRLWYALGSFSFAKLFKLEALAITCHHLSPYAHKSVRFVLHPASQ